MHSMSEPCQICGSSSTRLWLQRGEWAYYECTNCSCVALAPLPDGAWASGFYDAGYFAGGGRGGYQNYLADEVQHRSNARARIEIAQRFNANPPAGWLDVGCAVGYTLDEARKAGYSTLGVELSEWASAEARERFGLSVVPTLTEARTGRVGDLGVVSFFQVLEHLIDPVADLCHARACLGPSGLVLIETWDRSSAVARFLGRHWQQITPPSVVWLFDRNSLSYVLERAGLRVVAVEHSSKEISVAWALGLLSDKLPAFFGPLLTWLGGSAVGRLAFKYGLGDLITVVAAARDQGSGHPPRQVA